MAERIHSTDREHCPFLPQPAEPLGPEYSKSLRGNSDYFHSTLICAQSLWLQEKPAQALLQLNHALSVSHQPSQNWPLPYQAKIWIFTHRHQAGFLGNPVRHYQHLASRVSGPNYQLRSWRAWACFHLAESVLPTHHFPRDTRQILKENLIIPSWPNVLEHIHLSGWKDEARLLKACLKKEKYH